MLIRALQAAAGNFGVAAGYAIDNSLRFNDNDSAYLSRTPSVAGNRKTWTWSGWVKRGNLGFAQYFFSTSNASSRQFFMSFGSSDNLIVLDWNGSTQLDKRTTQLFRDVSGWYHIAVAVDTTQAIASDRVKIYVNGTQITSFSTNLDPGLNYDGAVNTTDPHALGREEYGDNAWFDGYLAEINFIDGQALTADDFGQMDATTGEWSPKAYAGTYGTNGFYLPFDGNANDNSGNGNNWTENNLASTDYMIDTPTNNFATFNPLQLNTGTLSEGSLRNSTGTSYKYGQSTISIPESGKWVFEGYFLTNATISNYNSIGVTINSPIAASPFAISGNYGIEDSSSTYNQAFIQNGVAQGSITLPAGTIIQLLVDRDNNELKFVKNGVLQTGTGSTVTLPASGNLFAVIGHYNTSQIINFGADSSFAGNKTRQGNTDANGKGDFYYAPPTGYLALCTDNL
jgi:hypothetical protein